MYLNTPCRNYGEVREAIEARSLVVRVVKNRSGELCGQVENGRVGIAMGFALQMILPAACAVACAVFARSWAALSAVAVYGLLPFVLPLNGFVSAAMTLAGLFGLAGGWSPVLVALLLPGVFYSAGKSAWWFFIQLGLIKDIMASRDRFERLWKQKLFALQDRDGIYQYGGLDGDRGGRT